jgi:hypothetical protein
VLLFFMGVVYFDSMGYGNNIPFEHNVQLSLPSIIDIIHCNRDARLC